MELPPSRCVNIGMKRTTVRVFGHLLAASLTINLALCGTDAVHRARVQAKEAQLRQDLRAMRKMIDQYTADEQRAPDALEDLVDAGYLVEVPKDPMTGSSATWEVIAEEDPISITGDRGIVDVTSGSQEVDASGERRYADW